MERVKIFFLILFVFTLVFAGCQKNETPTSTDNSSSQLSKLGLPSGAIFNSATLYINNTSQNSATVNIHRITSDWSELGVTWNNFMSSYAANIEGSFTALAGWQSADISALVQGWLNETYPNYGLLLAQPNTLADISEYDSRETDNDPYIVVSYTLNGLQYNETIKAFADTYIWELPEEANSNFGDATYLYVGHRNGYEKQTLLRFDNNYTPTMGCETAYAYGNNLATCFLSIPNINSNNWGWTNRVSTAGTYNWPIYAGAGQCDIDKGTLVGTLTVVYTGTSATISYNVEAPYTISERHLWIGTDKLPKNKKGQYITAPGQFNYNGYSNPVTINGLTSPFYTAAHFGVCWER